MVNRPDKERSRFGVAENAIALVVLGRMRFTGFALFAAHTMPKMNWDYFEYDEITIPRSHTDAESHHLFRR
ncbi:MAG: hypothetical protein AB1861_03615 [Cyanobacteriota bacterium]